jgi:hypothetical protein
MRRQGLKTHGDRVVSPGTGKKIQVVHFNPDKADTIDSAL